jgi:hypothetical protein
MSASPPDLIHRFITARKAATLFVIPAVYSLFDGLRSRFTPDNGGVDPVEPGRPAETVTASTS